MKSIIALITSLYSFNVLAGGGYTWLGGISHSLHLDQHVVTFFFVTSILFIAGIVYRTKVKTVDSAVIPDNGFSFRNVFEFFGEFLYNLAKSIMGEKEAKTYFAFIVTLFLTIFLNNLIGVVPGFLPPTDNLNTTLAIGLFVFLYYNYEGIRVQGFIGHMKHFMGPVIGLAPLMLVIELISHAVRPVSLGLRLKGNMEGDHLVLSIFSGLAPYLIPVPFYALGIFVSFVQAFVFTLLTMIYIGSSVEVHDHDHH